jgi:hypothetical protein
MRFILLTLLFFSFPQIFFSQIKDFDDRKIPIKLVAHTDSSLFILGKKAYAKNRYDLYIAKYSAYKKVIDFDTSLHFAKLFSGKFNPDNFKYATFQCDHNMVIIFDAIIGNNKTIIAKTIDFTGKVSDSFIVDEMDISNANFLESVYDYDLTAKKDILITIKRRYKSGYQRDKCILIDGHLKKIWDYELPKINPHVATNYIAEVYNSTQLIYHVINDSILGRKYGLKLATNTDTIIKKEVDGLTYNLKVLKDSLTIFVAYPLKKEVKILKVYWPFESFPIITPISSSQYMFYDLVDIDDAKFVLPGKKAMYYKRIDINTGTDLYEKLIPMERKMQDNLTYFSGEHSRGPTFKNFVLPVEKMIDGKLFSVFEHRAFDDAELIVSCFNIADNKFEWMNLLPRRLSTNASLYDLVVTYSKRQLNIGYYENMDNMEVPLEFYRHKKHKIARENGNSHLIQISIDENGHPVKSIANKSSEAFLFPWLGSTGGVESPHFFESKAFLPLTYLFKFP